MRFWDAARPDASFMVSGPPQLLPSPAAAAQEASSALGRDAGAPLPVAYVYSHKSMQGVGVVEESCISRSTDLQWVPPFDSSSVTIRHCSTEFTACCCTHCSRFVSVPALSLCCR